MKIAYLRKSLPDWRWASERNGFGPCVYYGSAPDGSEVVIRSYSLLFGPNADDFETQWRAEWIDNGRPCSTSFSYWLMVESVGPRRDRPATEGGG